MAIEKHILSKNRLQYETSPYLLQHAENPVDWYPWGEEAFRKAATENKPILLSIGYSSCHWCHVMARESFSDPQVAALMNRVFVNIKVDREERPDIDQFYMLVCQMMTGRGGWPLTVIMTPDKKPVFAATYLPPHTRGNMLGMAEMALKLEELWRLERRKVVDSSEQIADSLELAMTAARGEPLPLDKDLEERAFKELEQSYDDKNGGFGTAPKFPSIHTLLFILLYWRRHQDASARQIVEHTLFRMAGGGIFDQIGFGFHRYSTDAHWILPHFEKMLYDQAMFALIYADAFSAFGKKEYAATAEKTIAYVLQTLTSVEGAFFSAQDADSEGEEGKYYVWTAEEVKKVLGTEAGRFALELFSMTDAGNFADESTGRRNGANIALRRKELEAIAGDFDLRPDQAAIKAEEVRSRLAEARRQRFAPRIDDKILVDWNGLMIGALARAGRILGNRVYTEAAAKAADFLWQSCRADAALFHCYCKGKLSGVGFLSDYAFLSWGLFELYQSTFEARHLKHAKLLLDEMLQRFWDKNKGDFFYSDPGERDLPMPTKESADGAIPSGTSIALYLLNRFATLSGEERYAEHARQLSASLGSRASHLPQAYLATLYFHGISDENSAQLVLCGSRGAIDGSPLMAYLRSAYHPDLAVYLEGDTARSPLTSLLPGLSSCGTTANGKLTAYLCRNRQCLPPVANPEELWRQLQH